MFVHVSERVAAERVCVLCATVVCDACVCLAAALRDLWALAAVGRRLTLGVRITSYPASVPRRASERPAGRASLGAGGAVFFFFFFFFCFLLLLLFLFLAL